MTIFVKLCWYYGLFVGSAYLLTETVWGTVAGFTLACAIQYALEVVDHFKKNRRS